MEEQEINTNIEQWAYDEKIQLSSSKLLSFFSIIFCAFTALLFLFFFLVPLTTSENLKSKESNLSSKSLYEIIYLKGSSHNE